MKPRVLLRFDASPLIGRGHASRCLALAEAFREAGWEAGFLCRETLPAFRLTCEERGIMIRAFGSDGAHDEDPAEVSRRVRQWQAKLLVVDSYAVGPSYLDALRRSDICVMHFDDLTMIPPAADIVINGNAGAAVGDYGDLAGSQSRILAGPQYAVLRPGLRQHRVDGRRVRATVREVLVMLGSGGTRETHQMVLEAVARCLPACRVALVHWDARELRTALAECSILPKLDVQVWDNPADLFSIMVGADLAVTAAGVSSLELACLGIPMILFQAATNQESNIRGLVGAGAAVSVGELAIRSRNALSEALQALAGNDDQRAVMSRAGQALVDGEGGRRIVAAATELLRAVETPCAV